MNYNIFEFLKLIPQGKLMTYKQLAEIFGIENGQRYIGKILSANKYPDMYPCYKIVHSNGDIGSYLGNISNIDKKIKKIKEENIYIKENKILNIDRYLWHPTIHNIFIAIELDEEAKNKLYLIQKNIINEFKNISNIINFQNYNTAHITLYFLGNNYPLSNIIKKFKQLNIFKLNTNLYFDKIDTFGNKRNKNVIFLTTTYDSVYRFIYEKYLLILDIFNLPKQEYEYIPHITIGRIKDTKLFNQIETKLIKLLKNYQVKILNPKLNIYIAINNHHQFKLFI